MASMKGKVNPCTGETVKDTSEVKSNGGSNLLETGNRRTGAMINTSWKRHVAWAVSKWREYPGSFVLYFTCTMIASLAVPFISD